MAPTSALLASTKDSEQAILDAIEHQFQLDNDALLKISGQFLEDFRLGLGQYNHPMAMIPTYVTGVPNGSETGTFLALDLGGTNLRVCEVQLQGNHEFTLRQQKYRVSEALKTGEATALFDYLADSVDAFLTDNASSPTNAPADPFASGSSLDFMDSGLNSAIPLGLTFSFPVEQTALNEGKILTWTKGFSAKNAVGHDVVGLLQDAFDRKHLHVRCVALVNDTVGALLSRAYSAGDCLLGAIFGTGTNGAYLEKVENITKLGNSAARKHGGHMVVNCEWGAFNNTRTTLPTTPFDNKLDRESINPRLQAFEKFISGMYLGEITRNILLSLVDAAPHPLLFNGRASRELNQHYGLDTAVMSEIEEAWEKGRGTASGADGVEGGSAINTLGASGSEPKVNGSQPHFTHVDELSHEDQSRLERIRSVIIQRLSMDAADVSLRDAAIVRWAASLVANRAAKLSGCAVAAIMAQTGFAKLGGQHVPEEQRFVIGVDGSLIEHYPNFNARLRESVRALIGEEVEKRIELGMAKDGSGVGAALGALQATKHGL
ncbi:glucokinase [Steccherinum ochraceum]|uniref:Phosphotransferase n=1 Tax=Steccherinum ochraceum TaxID=92696 RepID=A0A4R0RRM0_9APHY|nr:glucokinase [Steccherinum ochraceum]